VVEGEVLKERVVVHLGYWLAEVAFEVVVVVTVGVAAGIAAVAKVAADLKMANYLYFARLRNLDLYFDWDLNYYPRQN
jgi:hypothetical protein